MICRTYSDLFISFPLVYYKCNKPLSARKEARYAERKIGKDISFNDAIRTEAKYHAARLFIKDKKFDKAAALLKSIKTNDPNANIIMCSAMGQQAMVIEAIQSGAKDFIVKPFQAERVLEAVKKVFSVS